MAHSTSLSITIVDRDGNRPLAASASTSSSLLDLAEVAVAEVGGVAIYDVVGRRIAIDAAGGITAELRVARRRETLAERLGERVMMVATAVLTAALFGGLLALWYLFAVGLEETIGWGVAHADWVVFATVFGYFVWRASSAKDPWVQGVCGFGAFGFGFLALVFVQVHWMGAGDPAWQRSLDYQALGADLLAHREKWLGALALYTPTILLVLRFAGLAATAETLERLGIGKSKK